MLRLAGTFLHIDLILDVGEAAGKIAGKVVEEVAKRRTHAMTIHIQGTIRVHLDAVKELLIDLGDADDGFNVVLDKNLIDKLAVKILGIHFIFLSYFTPIYKLKRPKLNKNSGRNNFGGFLVLFELFKLELDHV